MAQTSAVYSLRFHRGMYDTPILYTLGKRFRVTVTIRRAVLNEEGGWMEVGLAGDEEEVSRAVADLQTTGVTTTGPLTDAVEPDYTTYIPATVGRGT